MQDEQARDEQSKSEATDPTDPAAMLALIQQQQRRTERQLFSGLAAIPLAFGASWLLGYAVLFLAIRPEPVLPLSRQVALGIYFGLLALAALCTWWAVGRSSRGLRGTSQRQATMYGFSWMIGMTATTTVLAAVTRLGVDEPVASLLWSAMPGLMAGMLLVSGGAVFSDVGQFKIGLWVVLSTTASTFAGIPNHYLVMSLAGGGGLILFGVSQLRAEARANRAARQAGDRS
ncbi:hypothetical protein TL08_24350 [Actinoalloteichus hymeniacidonis]|uniref:Uncharacterized protein n=2 Tax=Actinoalloteichus hymeniacidonis TaxID=340345 RepID=A0AAC9HUF4_9PSEU|nr:hypothetical protein TL08_24350 [Actinoalloteichus hymeniacidonis]